MNEVDNSQFHDASLLSVHIDWPKGVVEFNLQTRGGPRTLRADKFQHLLIPRTLAWGPSNSIHEMHRVEKPEKVVLRIKMQSGDEIVVEAQAVTL